MYICAYRSIVTIPPLFVCIHCSGLSKFHTLTSLSFYHDLHRTVVKGFHAFWLSLLFRRRFYRYIWFIFLAVVFVTKCCLPFFYVEMLLFVWSLLHCCFVVGMVPCCFWNVLLFVTFASVLQSVRSYNRHFFAMGFCYHRFCSSTSTVFPSFHSYYSLLLIMVSIEPYSVPWHSFYCTLLCIILCFPCFQWCRFFLQLVVWYFWV